MLIHNIDVLSVNPQNLRSREFLTSQVEDIVNFYYTACIDKNLGGYINQFRDDGTIFDDQTKHLVGTCRFIFNFSTASIILDRPELKAAAEHGISFLLENHCQPSGGYAWLIDGLKVSDATNHCYGHAFVLLAYASALKAGIAGVKQHLEDTFELVEERFWDADYQLCVDQISPDWLEIDPYRGQNANMHMCEAMIAAYEATNDSIYLDRATTLARRICVDLADNHEGLVWEHYDQTWQPDWDYNLEDPKNLFRPYGYLTGHWLEWAKLLLILEEHDPQDWMPERSVQLFEAAISKGWDGMNGGFNYSLNPAGHVVDSDRYYWVLSEAIAASGLLAQRTGDNNYWDWYQKAWDYSLEYLVDTEHGAWYRILNSLNERYDNLKSPASKTDYHPLAACWELMSRF
jgi:mannose/cellobiose epimerase-like protein (N-acyl-D-glucosamine 2-epimerase family)